MQKRISGTEKTLKDEAVELSLNRQTALSTNGQEQFSERLKKNPWVFRSQVKISQHKTAESKVLADRQNLWVTSSPLNSG